MLRRADGFLPLILAYPLLLLAISSDWIFTPAGYIDPWVYYGYFRDFVAFKNDSFLASHYYGSRLSWLLPGFLVHHFLNPESASIILHLGVYYVAVFSLYFTLKRTVGRRGGLIGALLLGGYTFFLNSAGWDYVDGAVIAYCLLALACLTHAASGASPRTGCTAAGAAAAAMVHANVISLALCPLLGLFWLALPRICEGNRQAQAAMNPRSLPAIQAFGWFLAGAASLSLLLCFVNHFICGTWLFFLPSFRFALQSALIVNPAALPVAEWLPRARWLVLPVAAGAAVALASIAGYRRRRVLTHTGLFGALLAITFLLCLALESWGAPMLQLFYYASYLTPWLFLALAAALSPLLQGLSPAGFTRVATVCAVAFPFPLWGASLWTNLGAQFGLWLPLAVGALLMPALLPIAPSPCPVGAGAARIVCLSCAVGPVLILSIGSSQRAGLILADHVCGGGCATGHRPCRVLVLV